jgi:hypothetical protein
MARLTRLTTPRTIIVGTTTGRADRRPGCGESLQMKCLVQATDRAVTTSVAPLPPSLCGYFADTHARKVKLVSRPYLTACKFGIRPPLSLPRPNQRQGSLGPQLPVSLITGATQSSPEPAPGLPAAELALLGLGLRWPPARIPGYARLKLRHTSHDTSRRRNPSASAPMA